jgi:hypothetical protein
MPNEVLSTHEHDLQSTPYYICQSFSCLNKSMRKETNIFDTANILRAT